VQPAEQTWTPEVCGPQAPRSSRTPNVRTRRARSVWQGLPCSQPPAPWRARKPELLPLLSSSVRAQWRGPVSSYACSSVLTHGLPASVTTRLLFRWLAARRGFGVGPRRTLEQRRCRAAPADVTPAETPDAARRGRDTRDRRAGTHLVPASGHGDQGEPPDGGAPRPPRRAASRTWLCDGGTRCTYVPEELAPNAGPAHDLPR
jgi:hypothetical protein